MINDLDIVQWEYLLSPEFELINSAGKPLTGGWIEVYLHGTRNKYYCASDFSGTLHPFQIPLDSIGANVVLADPNNAYDVYVYNKYGSLIMSRYNVKCHGGGSGSSTYVGDRLYYGQFKATDVATQAGLTRVKGNIDVDDGKLELKQDMSYHITLRGEFVVNEVSNVDTVLSYIEYSAVKPINVNVDYTKDGSQYFEISYDIYRLAEDMDYPVSFLQSNGLVKNLVVEVHSLSNLATTANEGSEYEPGWGIVIQNNVISVDPSIFEEYAYTAGDYISIEDNTISVTGIDPNNYVTYEFLDAAIASAISGLDDGTLVISVGVIEAAADNTEVWDEIARLVDSNKYGVFVRHPNYENAVGLLWRGTRPETHDTLYHTLFLDYYGNGTATVRGEWVRGVTYRETRSDVKYLSQVYHDGTLTGSGTAEDQLKVNHQFVPYFEDLTNAVTAVSSVLHDEIVDVSESIIEYQAGSGINFTTNGDAVVINADPIDLTDYVTHVELIEAVSAVTGLGEYGQFYCAACTGTAELGKVKGTLSVTNDGRVSLKKGCSYHVTVRGGVEVDSAANTYGAFGLTEFITGNSINSNIDRTIEDTQYFEISYDLYNLSANTDYEFAFTNVGGSVNALYVEIHEIGHVGSGSGGAVTGTAEYDAGWGINIVNNVISVDPTVIPEQVQSDWGETASALPSFIKNKPVEYDLVAGQNISIAVTGTNVIISSTGGSGGATYTEGFGIDITNNEIAIDPSVVALASAVNLDNILTYDVSTWNDFRTMLDSGTKGVFVKDNSEYVTEGVYDIGVLTYYDNSNAKFIRIMDGMTGTVNGRARMYTLTNSGVWSMSYVKLAPKVDGGFGISQAYNYVNDIETLSIDTDVVALASAVPVIELNSNSQVTAIDGHALAGGGSGVSYTAGTGIDITSNVISVDNTVAMKTDIPELPDEEEVEFEELNLNDYALASAIPDISNLASHTEVYEATVTAINLVTAIIPEAQVQSDWDQDDDSAPDYIKNKPSIPSVEGLATVEQVSAVSGYLQNEIDNIPGQVQSDWDQSDDTQVDYIKNKPDLEVYSTHEEVYSATVTAVQVATGAIPEMPEEEEVEFEELNLSDYALASSIPTVQLNSNNQVTAIDGHTLAGTGGSTYTAGTGIDITNDVISLDEPVQLIAGNNVSISVTGVSAVISAQGGGASYTAGTGIDITSDVISIDNTVALKTDIPDVSNLATKTELGAVETKVETVSGMITPELPVVAGTGIGITETSTEITIAVTGDYALASAIPDVSDMATKTWVGNQGYLTEVPNIYATDIEVYEATVTAINIATGVIPDTEDITFEEVVLSDYALASAIPDVSNFTTHAEVYEATVTAVQVATGAIPDTSDMATQTWVGNQGYLTSIPSNYVTETELTGAVSGFATKTEVTAGVQAATGLIPTDINPLITANITDIQVVNSLPASPVATVLYLIPEV